MNRTWLGIPLGILLALTATCALAADIDKTLTLDADEVELVNLIGRVQVLPTDATTFTAVVHVRGRDAQPGLVEIVTESGREGRILIQFPVEEHRDYVYPELGNGRTTVTLDDGSARRQRRLVREDGPRPRRQAHRGAWQGQGPRGVGRRRAVGAPRPGRPRRGQGGQHRGCPHQGRPGARHRQRRHRRGRSPGRAGLRHGQRQRRDRRRGG